MIILDIETTGFDPEKDEITQLSAYADNTGAKFNEFIKIKGEVSSTITKLTGITNEKLQNEGIDEAECFERFDIFLFDNLVDGDTQIIVCGHNIINFDLKFIISAMLKHKFKIPFFKVIDTYMLAKNREHVIGAPNLKLGTLKEYFNIKVDLNAGLHNALFDVLVTQKLYECLIKIPYDNQEPNMLVLENEVTSFFVNPRVDLNIYRTFLMFVDDIKKNNENIDFYAIKDLALELQKAEALVKTLKKEYEMITTDVIKLIDKKGPLNNNEVYLDVKWSTPQSRLNADAILQSLGVDEIPKDYYKQTESKAKLVVKLKGGD